MSWKWQLGSWVPLVIAGAVWFLLAPDLEWWRALGMYVVLALCMGLAEGIREDGRKAAARDRAEAVMADDAKREASLRTLRQAAEDLRRIEDSDA